MKVKTIDVLKVIGAGAFIVTAAAAPGLPAVFVTAHKLWKDINRKDFGRIIKRLEKQEMIFTREEGGNTIFEITDKGKKRLLEFDFENIELKAKKRDGKWRLIIFDVPEHKKKNRDAFRRKLLHIDCVRLQDSVFVSAFPCKEEVDFLCHYLEISDFVTLLTVGNIERGEQLLFKNYKVWD